MEQLNNISFLLIDKIHYFSITSETIETVSLKVYISSKVSLFKEILI